MSGSHYEIHISLEGRSSKNFYGVHVIMNVPFIPLVGDQLSFTYHSGICEEKIIPNTIRQITATTSRGIVSKNVDSWEFLYDSTIVVTRRVIDPDGSIWLYCGLC